MALWKPKRREEPPKPQEPQRPGPVDPQALEVMRSEAKRILNGPQTETISFDMEDLLAIIGEVKGEYDELPPVQVIRVHQLNVSLTSGEGIPKGIKVPVKLVEQEGGRAVPNRDKLEQKIRRYGDVYKETNRVIYERRATAFSEDEADDALKAAEAAISCDETRLDSWKAAGDYAVRAGNITKAKRYYSIVATLPQVRGGFGTINETNREVVSAAVQALKKL